MAEAWRKGHRKVKFHSDGGGTGIQECSALEKVLEGLAGRSAHELIHLGCGITEQRGRVASKVCPGALWLGLSFPD
jgi:hypothetical protein